MQNLKSVIEFGTNKWRVAVLNSHGENVFYKDMPSRRNLADKKIGEDYLFGCLNDFSSELKKFGLDIKNSDEVRAIATEGFRDGETADELITKIKQKMGVEIEIISAKREAELSAKAMISENEDRNKLIIDMGGGSTDIALYSAEAKKIVGTVSLVGSRFLVEKVDSDKDNRQKIFAEEEKKIQQALEEFKNNSNFDLYASNLDVVTNSSALMRVISKGEGHKEFDPKEIDGKSKRALDTMISMEELFQMKPKEIVDNGYSGFRAAPQTITGAFILKETLSALELNKNQEIKVSLKSPKEGLAIEMFEQEKIRSSYINISDEEIEAENKESEGKKTEEWQDRYAERLEKFAAKKGAKFKHEVVDEKLVVHRNDEAFVYATPNKLIVKGGKTLDGWRDQIFNAQEEGITSVDFSKISKEENKARLYMLCTVYGVKTPNLEEKPNVEAYLSELTLEERLMFLAKQKNLSNSESRKEKLEVIKQRVSSAPEPEASPSQTTATPRVPKKPVITQNIK